MKNMKYLLVITLLMCTTSFANIPRYAFVLFYMSSCPHCQRFDPILKSYALHNHIPVLAYTLDGQSLPSFPSSIRPIQSEIAMFFGKTIPMVPALFLMDNKKKTILPVLKGESSYLQLKSRIQQILGGNVS